MKLLLLILLVNQLILAGANNDRQSKNYDKNNENDDEYYGDQPTSYFEHNSLASQFNRKLTSSQYLSYSQRALKLVAGFDSDLHRYDSNVDLINSFERNLSYRDDLSHMRAHIDRSETKLLDKQDELTLIENEQNQSRCGRQLAYLLERIQHIMTNYTTYSQSKDLDILDLVDSFGSPESELMMGNSAWFGSYRQCLEAKFTMSTDGGFGEFGGRQQRTGGHSARYCIASFKPPPSTDLEAATGDLEISETLIKMAVCLPQSCNSISILRYGDQIELLAKLVRLNRIPYSHFKLSNLYCLPDENSPLRQFNLSAKLFILTLSSWLTIVLYFSLKYEYIRMNNFRFMSEKTNQTQDRLMQALAFRLSWSNLFSASAATPKKQKIAQQQSDRVSIDKMADNEARQSLMTNNLMKTLKSQNHQLRRATFGGKQSSSSPPLVCVVNGTSMVLNNPLPESLADLVTTTKKTTVVPATKTTTRANIDLSVMDGIKVVSMIWLIMAHTLLFFIRTIANGRDFWSLLRDARYLTVMAGIFPVDTFFTITGVLTAYLKFNKRDAIDSPSYWLEAFVHRYLRFMPMYLLVFWFTRDVSEHIGSGPLWDYSTASTSLRSVCKQESISVPLLFQANFKPLDHHCVKPAWYLANDYQFLLVTPLFMMLIMRSVRLGYSVIGLSIVFSLMAQFMTVFFSHEMDDFGALINFKPMFATYVLKNLWQLYVLPYNRIPPYLIGLLTGHFMYTRGSAAAAMTNDQGDCKNQTTTDLRDEEQETTRYPSRDSLNTASYTSSSSSSSSEDEETSKRSTSNILKTHHQSSSCSWGDYLCLKVWTPLVFLISIIYLPMLTKLMTQEGVAARIGTSSIIAFMRFVWSLAIARFIYIAATRHLEQDPTRRADCFMVRFLASPMWKPWSKIGLSALLIQWEVIGYLAQTQTSVPDMSMTFLLATMLASILVTYLLAILIYLTVEYPLSQFEQLYIIPAIFRK